MGGYFKAALGSVTHSKRVLIRESETTLIDVCIDELKSAWQSPLDW